MALRIGLDEEELALLAGANSGLPNGVRLLDEEMTALKRGDISLGLMGKAKRALSVLAEPPRTGQFMWREEKYSLATRNEVLALEGAVEGMGHMLLGIFEALKTKGILSQEELNAALRKTAEGVLEDRGNG
jgi:hypothetical protein